MNVKGLIKKYEKKYWETRPQCSNRNHEIEFAKKELLKEFLIDLEELENSSVVNHQRCMSSKLAVLMEFNGYAKDELEAYLSMKLGSMAKDGMTASFLSQSEYEKINSMIKESASSSHTGIQIIEFEKGERMMNEKQLEIIKSWANLKSREFAQKWTEDDELIYRSLFGESLMALPDEFDQEGEVE